MALTFLYLIKWESVLRSAFFRSLMTECTSENHHGTTRMVVRVGVFGIHFSAALIINWVNELIALLSDGERRFSVSEVRL